MINYKKNKIHGMMIVLATLTIINYIIFSMINQMYTTDLVDLFGWSLKIAFEALSLILIIAIITDYITSKINKKKGQRKYLLIGFLICVSGALALNQIKGQDALNFVYQKNNHFQQKLINASDKEIFQEASWSEFIHKYAKITGNMNGLGFKNYEEYIKYVQENKINRIQSMEASFISKSFSALAIEGFSDGKVAEGNRAWISDKCVLATNQKNIVEILICENDKMSQLKESLSDSITNEKFVNDLYKRNHNNYEFALMGRINTPSSIENAHFIMSPDYENPSLFGLFTENEINFLYRDFQMDNNQKPLMIENSKLILPPIFKNKIEREEYTLLNLVPFI